MELLRDDGNYDGENDDGHDDDDDNHTRWTWTCTEKGSHPVHFVGSRALAFYLSLGPFSVRVYLRVFYAGGSHVAHISQSV